MMTKLVGITINDFRWVEAEKSWCRYEARCSASNVNEVYDLTIFFPRLKGESHPASNLRIGSVRVNPGELTNKPSEP